MKATILSKKIYKTRSSALKKFLSKGSFVGPLAVGQDTFDAREPANEKRRDKDEAFIRCTSVLIPSLPPSSQKKKFSRSQSELAEIVSLRSPSIVRKQIISRSSSHCPRSSKRTLPKINPLATRRNRFCEAKPFFSKPIRETSKKNDLSNKANRFQHFDEALCKKSDEALSVRAKLKFQNSQDGSFLTRVKEKVYPAESSRKDREDIEHSINLEFSMSIPLDRESINAHFTNSIDKEDHSLSSNKESVRSEKNKNSDEYPEEKSKKDLSFRATKIHFNDCINDGEYSLSRSKINRMEEYSFGTSKEESRSDGEYSTSMDYIDGCSLDGKIYSTINGCSLVGSELVDATSDFRAIMLTTEKSSLLSVARKLNKSDVIEKHFKNTSSHDKNTSLPTLNKEKHKYDMNMKTTGAKPFLNKHDRDDGNIHGIDCALDEFYCISCTLLSPDATQKEKQATRRNVSVNVRPPMSLVKGSEIRNN